MQKRNILKLIIIITMTIDHLGALIFPELTWMRIIGRIAYPCAAYQAAQGYKYTSDLKKYFIRLTVFACISQIPYTLAFSESAFKLNPIFTILFGVIAIALWNKNLVFKICALVLCVMGAALPVSYGAYGIFMVFIFEAFSHLSVMRTIMIFVALNYVFYVNSIESGLPIQIFSVLALPIIYLLPNNKELEGLPEVFKKRIFYYIYYPAHIAVLYIISKCI